VSLYLLLISFDLLVEKIISSTYLCCPNGVLSPSQWVRQSGHLTLSSGNLNQPGSNPLRKEVKATSSYSLGIRTISRLNLIRYSFKSTPFTYRILARRILVFLSLLLEMKCALNNSTNWRWEPILPLGRSLNHFCKILFKIAEKYQQRLVSPMSCTYTCSS